MIHSVKCSPEYFIALQNRNKTFEVRRKNRPYQVGDLLAVNEFADFDYEYGSDETRERFTRVSDSGKYSGECLLFKITYILDDPKFCKADMVILGLARCEI